MPRRASGGELGGFLEEELASKERADKGLWNGNFDVDAVALAVFCFEDVDTEPYENEAAHGSCPREWWRRFEVLDLAADIDDLFSFGRVLDDLDGADVVAVRDGFALGWGMGLLGTEVDDRRWTDSPVCGQTKPNDGLLGLPLRRLVGFALSILTAWAELRLYRRRLAREFLCDVRAASCVRILGLALGIVAHGAMTRVEAGADAGIGNFEFFGDAIGVATVFDKVFDKDEVVGVKAGKAPYGKLSIDFDAAVATFEMGDVEFVVAGGAFGE